MQNGEARHCHWANFPNKEMYVRDKGAHFPLTILTYSAEEKRKPLQNISTYHMKAKV